MKRKVVFLTTVAIGLAACSPTPEKRDESSEESIAVSQSSDNSTSNLSWSSMEEAIEFYEKVIEKDLGKEMANIQLGGEFYERDSWQMIQNSGNTIVLSLKNVGYGGRNAMEFVKHENETVITLFGVDTPYPENPISRRTVRNSDLETMSYEGLGGTCERSLSDYSALEIEYARVWLEVIGKTDIDELIVSKRLKGDPINRYEETSATYPEDVVVLSATVVADGLVVYSSNGNGTITLYEVPYHWQQGILAEGETWAQYTSDIVKNRSIVPIGTGNEEDVIKLIERETIQN